MERNSVRYRIGLGGWEHDALDRCFYPREGMGSSEKLAYYAQFFNLTEVRHTFWDDSLTSNDAHQWVDAVCEARDFLFTVKLHKEFTHKQNLHPAMATKVRGILQELARHNRLGGLLLQFPYSFTNTGSNRRHVVKLSEVFRGFPMFVELRHASWESPSLLSFLAENAMQSVSPDLPRVRQYMPFITGTVGDTAYLRLHGRNEKGWLLNAMETRYDYLYNDRELMELRRRLDALEPRCRNIMMVCNNTTNGKAVANALQLSHAIRGTSRSLVPLAAMREFPSVRDFGVAMEGQGQLFSRVG